MVALDATALSSAIRSRCVSCRKVIAAHLARIDAVKGRADLAMLLSVMSGADPRAPLSIAEPALSAAVLEGGIAGRLSNLAGALAMESGTLPLDLEALGALRRPAA